MKTQLNTYNNQWYKPGRSVLIRSLWFFVSAVLVQCKWHPFSGLRIFLLRLFGAEIGRAVTIKPGVHVKYPWLMVAGDHVWIGENVWIDNLGIVEMGNHVCISQGAYLLTGNHDYSKPAFDLIIKPIFIEEGVWIGAKAIVCPGVICRSHAVLSVGSVARNELAAFTIYSGNPASAVKERVIK